MALRNVGVAYYPNGSKLIARARWTRTENSLIDNVIACRFTLVGVHNWLDKIIYLLTTILWFLNWFNNSLFPAKQWFQLEKTS